MSKLFNLESKIITALNSNFPTIFEGSFLTSPLFGTTNSSSFPLLNQAAEFFTSSPWYCYGFGNVIAIAFSSIFCVLLFDGLLRLKFFIQKHLLIYKKGEDRYELLEKQHNSISWGTQFKELVWQVAGPLNLIVGGVSQRFLLDWANGGLPATPLPSSTPIGLFLDAYLIATIADFGLYWFHRMQHENEYMWKNWHSKHHKVEHPTAVSTVYIAPEDSFLGAGVALIGAQMLVRAHPLTNFCYLWFHMANTIANHTGYEFFLLDFILLKWLPMRVASKSHDQHHRLGNRGKGAKLYAEFFNWDRIFGTECASVAKQTWEYDAVGSSSTKKKE